MADPESVWDYPRPPRLERSSRTLRVTLGGGATAETTRAVRVLETSHPPVYYFPLADVLTGSLLPSTATRTVCEWKGVASFYDVAGPDGRRVPRGAWCYPEPRREFEGLRNTVAFYPGAMDECFLDGERVEIQAGDFYGGWITSDILGPFKGGPGTQGW